MAQRPAAERKKIVGILCEVAPDGHSLVVGIGINLAQPQEYFDKAGLPHGTSLLCRASTWTWTPTPNGWPSI